MDVEGYELKVTEGMRHTLSQPDNSLKLLMEIHPPYVCADELKAWFEELFEFGFQPIAYTIPGDVIRERDRQKFLGAVCNADYFPHVVLSKDGSDV